MEDRPTDDPSALHELIPLTRRNEQGQLYTRDEDVEEQIKRLLGQAPDTILVQTSVADKASESFLREEVLVYFLRGFQTSGNEQAVTQLSKALLERFPSVTKHRLASLGRDEQDQAYTDVVQEIFSLIFDLSTDRADFLQVKFKKVLMRRAINAFDRYKQRRSYELTGMEGDTAEDEDNSSFRIANVPDPGIGIEERTLVLQ